VSKPATQLTVKLMLLNGEQSIPVTSYQRIDTWQAHVQADLTLTRNNFAMHKVTGCLAHGKVISGDCEVCLCPLHMRLPGVHTPPHALKLLLLLPDSLCSSVSFVLHNKGIV